MPPATDLSTLTLRPVAARLRHRLDELVTAPLGQIRDSLGIPFRMSPATNRA